MSRTRHHGYKKQYALFGDHHKWYSHASKIERKFYKHKPQRQATRRALHQVMKGNIDVLFPHNRKPITWW